MVGIRQFNLRCNTKLIIFGILDLITLSYHLILQLINGKIPLYTDWILGKNNIEILQMNHLYIFLVSTILLYLSFPFSIYLLFSNYKKVKWLVLLQTPLRIICLIPTIPFLVTFLSSLMSKTFISLLFIYLLVVILEIAKVIYFFRKY